ncbi:cell division topological specificity factor [Clostridium sp. CAG:470]|jgi:cell division topological specificity factor|nr:MAG: cell division topological specificity factor MinE [Clostridium sp. 28_17]CDE14710.1 cell division topological specificity factor [Clostridium sp. CAG:470]
MFENIVNFFKNIGKKEENKKMQESSKDAAKERLHLVLMQDRANVSADFLELMKQEIIDVIKKYIEVDEKEIDVRLTNKENDDGTNGAPALYANIPILNIKNDARKIGQKELEENKEKTAEIENNKQNEKEEKTDKKTESEKTTSNDHKTPKEMKEKNETKKADETEKTEQKETKNLEDKKDFETQEKIKEIIDGVIEDAENNKEKAKNEEQ